MHTVISTTGDQTSNHRLQSQNSSIESTVHITHNAKLTSDGNRGQLTVNASCKLHPYSLQRTRSPPGLCLPERIRNTHSRNYYDLEDKDIDVYFTFFLVEGLYCELNICLLYMCTCLFLFVSSQPLLWFLILLTAFSYEQESLQERQTLENKYI